MKFALRFAAPLFVLASVAGCDSIGEGNTIKTWEIIVSPSSFEQGALLDIGTATQRFHMYDCFCSNLVVLGTFTDGTIANFNSRAAFSSDQPGVVEVLNIGDEVSALCPAAQQGPGLLVPKGIGTATITATFAGLSATFAVEVADAAQNADGSPASYAVFPGPPASAAATDVAVGATLPLRVTGILDGRTRVLTENVVTWSFDNADDALATVSTAGVVSGIAPTGAVPRVARAAFGSCTDISPTLAVNVGDVLGPLVLERESPDFATDGMLAVGSDEELQATAPLDFDGDGNSDGSQLISSVVSIGSTDACTLRTYDANVPGTNCAETATTCSNTVAVCAAATSTSCPSNLTPCRTVGARIVTTSNNRIIAVGDDGAPTNFTATYPNGLGTPTTLAAGVDGAATALTVAALTGYPTQFPWYGVIDSGGTREDVRVTAADGTTLTVVRGIGGTTGAAHASGDSFEQRSYSSDPNAPLAIRGKEGTLTTVAVAPPGALAPLGTLQLGAFGTFVDAASASRQQRVTRLISRDLSPAMAWSGSDDTVATVQSGSGVVTSANICGGRVLMRARASNSTDTTTATFDTTTTADDDACENTDPLCDQVELCIATPSPLPLGAVCDTVTTCP